MSVEAKNSLLRPLQLMKDHPRTTVAALGLSIAAACTPTPEVNAFKCAIPPSADRPPATIPVDAVTVKAITEFRPNLDNSLSSGRVLSGSDTLKLRELPRAPEATRTPAVQQLALVYTNGGAVVQMTPELARSYNPSSLKNEDLLMACTRENFPRTYQTVAIQILIVDEKDPRKVIGFKAIIADVDVRKFGDPNNPKTVELLKQKFVNLGLGFLRIDLAPETPLFIWDPARPTEFKPIPGSPAGTSKMTVDVIRGIAHYYILDDQGQTREFTTDIINGGEPQPAQAKAAVTATAEFIETEAPKTKTLAPTPPPTKTPTPKPPTPKPMARPPATPTAVEINPQLLNLPQIKPNGPAERYFPWRYIKKPDGSWETMGAYKWVKLDGNTVVVAIDITKDNIDDFQEFRMEISEKDPFKVMKGVYRNKDNDVVPNVIWQTSSPQEAYAAIKHYGKLDHFIGVGLNGPMDDWLNRLKPYYQGYLMDF